MYEEEMRNGVLIMVIRRRRGHLPGTDLHDKTQHRWTGPHFSMGLWTMGYHIPSEYTAMTTILRVYGETKKQCMRRKKRITDALDGILIEEVSK